MKNPLVCALFVVFGFFFSGALWAYPMGPDIDPERLLQDKYPTWQIDHSSDPYPLWTLSKNGEVKAYAFATDPIVKIPAYSGKPVDMLVVMAPDGKFLWTRVLDHNEPILLVGIPEEALTDFVDEYQNMSVTDRIRVGSGEREGMISVDSVTGATVTVMVVNQALMRAARTVAKQYNIAGLSDTSAMEASLNMEFMQTASWETLTGDGSIRRLNLNRGDIDDAFKGTAAEGVDDASAEQREEPFIDLFYTPLNAPAIGRNLLGDDQYDWLMGELKEGDQAIAVVANGRYSFKGNGYVRGGIFDRVQLLQEGRIISFHDLDYYRLSDVFIEGFPGYKEMAIFIARAEGEFNPAEHWQLELLVRRQIGALQSEFVSFYGDYLMPDAYRIVPEPVIDELESEPLWVSVWKEKAFQSSVLVFGLVVLSLILFFQDLLVQRPRFLKILRTGFLIYTVCFIGWYALGQLSIVNVFTFIYSLLGDFRWDTFLLDPTIFILWCFVAMSLLLWGRGVYCGWLCPFGAMQELINELGRKLGVKQWELPFVVHERLWAIKYLILLGLFGISLESMANAERFAEVEPFKTAVMLKFAREWGFVLYAASWLVVSLFTRKVFCRYVCPLGAALSVPARHRIFDWLKRRPQCGRPCQLCANECEIQAIHPNGEINMSECHHCLDCQVTYFDQEKCPPLILKNRKKKKKESIAEEIPVTQV
ncbi:transcriptional regulator NosR [Aestuariirhabdus haliotis]|uniref:transcriptional regulator NosR n=1 Tax=Aestuariirhabdus haliotis TaxID=2918751 RepID=UPI0020BE7FDA|nr:NosR/NirI family protein [Aestuariirhabdus haliotis]MCL6421097.1 NosR/NirI family protein [Aestuariirhabdus haliotis]